MSLLWMLLLFSLLIVAHELGHLFVARWCGVKVERFGLGLPFGKPLWKGQLGSGQDSLELCIHPVPLGGYVAFPDDDAGSRIPLGSKKRFENQPPLQKTAIVLAGVAVNALLAWVLTFWIFMGWGKPGADVFILNTLTEYTNKPSSYLTMPSEGAFSTEARLLLNGQTLETTYAPMLQTLEKVQSLDGSLYELTFERRMERITPLTATLVKPSIAALAGLRSGDHILQVGETPLSRYPATGVQTLMETLKTHAQQPVTLVVRQEALPLLNASNASPSHTETLTEPSVLVTPQRLIQLLPDEKGRIGIQLGQSNVSIPSEGIADASISAWDFLSGVVAQNTEGLTRLVTGRIQKEELAGPVRIVSAGAKIIEKDGLHSGILLAAVISMILAVMNLLPIPPLDGSYLVYIVVETITGKKLNKQVQGILSTLGFWAFLLLSAFVFYNDITQLIK
ncbi:MAG: M50 family metallopeptidase [Vampirovibrionales bacterium]